MPQRIQRYFKTVEAYDIPCEGMYVSSGYLKHHDEEAIRRFSGIDRNSLITGSI